MSTPTEDPQKSPPMTIRLDADLKEDFLKYAQKNNLKQTQAWNTILRSFLLGQAQQNEEKLDLQSCEYWSAIPSHLDYIRCRKEGWFRTIPTKQCEACFKYKIVKVPLQTIERLEVKVNELTLKRNDLKADIEVLTMKHSEEYDTSILGLESRLKDTEKKLKCAMDILRERTPQIEKLKEQIGALETTVREKDKSLITLQTQLSPLRTDGKKPLDEAREIHSRPESPRVFERIIEEKRTTERMSLEESKPLSKLVLCPLKKDHVEEEVCKNCPDVTECAQFLAVIENRRN